MKHTAEERVLKGIYYLDKAAQLGKVSKYWRNHISVKDIRIDNPDKGVLGQLFGSYNQAKKKIGLFGYYAGSHLGFLHYPRPYRDYTMNIRKAWEEALKTEPAWNSMYTNDNYDSTWTRTINGVRYVISQFNNSFVVSYKLAGNLYISNDYNSLESAKRSVRKLSNKK